MAAIDPLYAQWLQSPSLYAARSHAAIAARWGERAIATERLTGIALKSAADVQGDRELAFLARGPFAVDEHQLVGTDWTIEIGRVVTLTIDQLGYDAGVDVFVLEVETDRARGLTKVAVLCPLGAGA